MVYSVRYILGFSVAVCVVCALFVAGSAVSLRKFQDRNVLLDRQKNVLVVAGLLKPDEDVSGSEIEARFDKSIRAKVIDLATGEEDPNADPHTFDQQAAAKDPATSSPAPPNGAKILRIPNQALIYEVLENGEVESVILPIQGYGLWSVLYGYLALAPDGNTVRGITYYQQGETAGLGGEVDNPRWKAHWPGRKVYGDRGNVQLSVIKGPAGPPSDDPYHVDGLSGATLTSRGVTNMIHFWLGPNGFEPYLDHLRKRTKGAA